MDLMQSASLLSRPAEEFGNDGLVEEMWAVKAMDHAEIYFNLLTSVHPSLLRLTPYDDQIHQTFRQDFPDLKIDLLTDDILKSTKAKLSWRQFAENSLLVVRIQFLAIEIARNREGLNDEVYRKFRPPPKIITRTTAVTD